MNDSFYFNTIESTNIEAKKMLSYSNAPDVFMLRTDFQNSGKGYGSNVWQSDRNKNLLCSIVLNNLNLSIEKHFCITQYLSVILSNFIKGLIGEKNAEHIRIKWPNDIYYKKTKLAGILIENELIGNNINNSILGIGLNINQNKFPSTLANPISIAQICHKEFDIETIAKAFFAYFKQHLNSLTLLGDEYEKKLFQLKESHSYIIDNKNIEAVIQGVDEFGQLILKTKNNSILLCSVKEIVYVL